MAESKQEEGVQVDASVVIEILEQKLHAATMENVMLLAQLRGAHNASALAQQPPAAPEGS